MKREATNAILFDKTNAVPTQYPWLSFDEECDVLVIGGGVTGCMAANTLARAGVSTVLISKRPIGYCSSAIDSSTLNYQNELMLTSLVEQVGRAAAVSYFEQCSDALSYLEELSADLNEFDFARRDSFIYTNSTDKINDLHTEYLMRKHNGYDVLFVEKAEAGNLFSFEVKAGILSKNSGGEVNSYKLCHALAENSEKHGARVYENTSNEKIVDTDEGIVVLTNNNRLIMAKKVLFATGYKQDEYLNRLCCKKRSYFLATSPLEAFSGFESRALVRNIDHDINLRSTIDNRVIINGLDNQTIDRNGKIGKLISIDKLLSRKFSELETDLSHMLCGINSLESEYVYSGIYGSTKDNMPIIGEHSAYKNTYFDLPCSINGILQSIIGAKLITKSYLGEDISMEKNIFSPNRKTL